MIQRRIKTLIKKLKNYHSLNSIKDAIKNGETNCYNLTEAYIRNIREYKSLNAFVEVFDSEALNQAKKIDDKISKGTAGKLAGMVIGIKDNICYKNHKSTASSKILKGFHSLYNATVVDRLIKEDAIIIGRLNCDEFAMGSANENSIYGSCKNPVDTTKVCGGSSGGSAAAVKAKLCLAALGSDTGGSIRQPSSFCGNVGLKPTYSRVSRYGLIAFASSFDQIGPITNTIEDAAIILEVISGQDDYDSTISTRNVDEYSNFTINESTKRIAYFPEFFNSEGLSSDIKNEIKNQIKKLKNEGHIIEPVTFPYFDYLVPTYYVLSTAEASSNLARFDGVHYGYRSKDSNSSETTYFNTRTEGFGSEVKRRIMLGTFVLSAGHHDAYYTKAQKMRRLIQNKTNEIFKKYDFILGPTTPHTAFELNRKDEDPVSMYLEDIYTVLANLTGNPAISLPIGKDNSGMPFGTQIMAKPFHERELLSFSKHLINTL